MKRILSTQKAFTLIELLVVVVIVAIFAAITIPSYQAYVRRAQEAQAQQEVHRIAGELERWKSRNFNYLNYDISSNSVRDYAFIVRDGSNTSLALNATGAIGRSWVIQALYSGTDNRKYSFLMTSTGLQCKNKTKANLTFTGCGTGSESW